jgi:hypothetical protein
MTFAFADTMPCGSLRTKQIVKGPNAWEFRYYETIDGSQIRKRATIGLSNSIGPKLPRGRLLHPIFGNLTRRLHVPEQ